MKLQELDGATKYWVIRPGEKGRYFRHFKDCGVVALGHIDEIVEEEGIVESINGGELQVALSDHRKQKRKSTSQTQTSDEIRLEGSRIVSIVTQVKTFINEVKIGDVVITLNPDRVLVGTVTSDAFIEKGDLRVSSGGVGYTDSVLKYALRRNVDWGQIKKRESIPTVIKSSLSPSQTIFSISEKNTELFTHWLYSIFLKDGRLYFSTKINKKEKINQFQMLEFQRSIQKLEILTDLVFGGDLEGKNLLPILEDLYFQYGDADEFSLTAKSSYLSPGNIWSDVLGDDRKLRVLAFALGMLFSVEVTAVDENDLSPEQIRYLEDAIATIKDEGNFDKMKAGIVAALDQPNHIIKDIEPTIPKKSKKNYISKNQ